MPRLINSGRRGAEISRLPSLFKESDIKIDRRAQNTEMAMMIAKGAQQQRKGVNTLAPDLLRYPIATRVCVNRK